MCLKKQVPEKEVPPYQIIKSVGVAYTADQIAMLVLAGLSVEYRSDSLKLYAFNPYWECSSLRVDRLIFFQSEK